MPHQTVAVAHYGFRGNLALSLLDLVAHQLFSNLLELVDQYESDVVFKQLASSGELVDVN